MKLISLLLVLLTFGSLGCDEENPYFDSSNWNMNQTVDRLARIVQRENSLILEARDSNDLSETSRRDLWALFMDECDIGFEVWVRLRRNRRLVSPFCEAYSIKVAPLLEQRAELQVQGSDVDVFYLKAVAPNPTAGIEFEIRFNAFGARALQERCLDREGYRQRHWP